MIAGCLLILSALGAWIMWGRSPSEDAPPRLLARSQFTWLHLWTSLPDRVAAADRTRDQYSNIAPQDYVKPDACAECHPDQHRMWENHPHSRMNATASSKTVFGRFDGSSIDLQGGTISMFQRNDDYWVRMDGHDIEREFRVTRTIGSRFYQFYVGRLESGAPLPALPAEHGEYPQQELVLPVAYRPQDDTWTPAYDHLLCLDHDTTTTSSISTTTCSRSSTTKSAPCATRRCPKATACCRTSMQWPSPDRRLTSASGPISTKR